MLLIQCRYVDNHSPGTKRTFWPAPGALAGKPSPTTARHNCWIDLPGKNVWVAGAGLVSATNHWSVSIGSTTSSVRPQRGTPILGGFSLFARPAPGGAR